MTKLPRLTPAKRRILAAFRRDEDGSFVIFSLYLFVMMLMIGGFAVDMMRYEVTRSRIQNTLDRAILAAADLDQTQPPADVVQNYFQINGMLQFLNEPTVVTGGLNARTVNANASATVPMMFANMIGITTMETQTYATATESVEDIEITLVLDISGSMGWNNKLQEMQAAAKDFIDIIYSEGDHEDISISIVPYSTQVDVGLALMEEFTVDWQHDESTCVDFSASDYNNPSITTTETLAQTSHFDPWYYWGPMHGDTQSLMVCRNDPGSEVLTFSNVEADLRNHIDALTAGGNTSIEIGVKWGTALLHHDAQPVIAGLVADGIVPPEFNGRPYEQTTGASLKIMVVMTDGVNTTEYRLTNSIRDGWSTARVDPETGHFYIPGNENGDRDGDGDSNETYFVPHLFHISPKGDFWRRNNDGLHDPNADYVVGSDDDDDGDGQLWDDDPSIDDTGVNWGETYANRTIQNGTMVMRYDELYDRVSMRYHAWYHHYAQFWNADHFYDWVTDIRWSISGSQKDARLDVICDAAKNYGVLIYTIGFEVTDDSAAVMENCASSPFYFYRVAGPEIGDAFRAIARQVNELRLIH